MPDRCCDRSMEEMRYKQMWDGKPHNLKAGSIFLFQCCHCGLVHRMKMLPITKGNIEFTVWVDKDETEAVRAARRRKNVRKTRS